MNKIYNFVKYSPPIEAGASFNPPNLAKDCILRASVSEAMGFLWGKPFPYSLRYCCLTNNFWKPYMYILATHIYIVKEKVSLAADGQFIPPPKRWGTSCPFRLNFIFCSLPPSAQRLRLQTVCGVIRRPVKSKTLHAKKILSFWLQSQPDVPNKLFNTYNKYAVNIT